MINDPLHDELMALVATLDDDAEARALVELFAIAGTLATDDDQDNADYTPFVYPH